MTDSFKTDSFRRSFLTVMTGGVAALSLMACGGGDAPSKAGVKGDPSQFELAGDHAIGSKDAAVTFVEYASVTCPHCSNWSKTVYPDFKKKYIDTGKVRYIFRPFPTPPQELADAGHMIAMCAGDDKFLANIKYQFENQTQIMNMARAGEARKAYVGIAKNSGLSEEEFTNCITNPDIQKEYQAVVQGGIDAGVTGTPAFFVNGEYMKKTPSGGPFYTLESIDEVILPILGEPVPEKETETETTESAE
jgi:protein-disulfide isomerase